MVGIILFIAAATVLCALAYACCKAAGDADEMAEKILKKENKS